MRMVQRAVLYCLIAGLPALSQSPQDRPQDRSQDRNQNRNQDRQQRPNTRPSPNAQNDRRGPDNARPNSSPSTNRPSDRPSSNDRRPDNRPPAPRADANNSRPRPQPTRPNPPRPPQRPNRPAQWGRPPHTRPPYTFRPNDRDYLRRFYLNRMRYINRARRPVFRVGGYFPVGDIGYLTTVPPSVYGTLPPPPPGYQMGYFDGYVVVYDPVTYFIANLVDLLQ